MGKNRSVVMAGALRMVAIPVALTPTPAMARDADQRTDHLPAQSLAAALRAVAALSGRSIVAPAALIADRQAPALDGDFTTESAVTALLRGSGLHARAVRSEEHTSELKSLMSISSAVFCLKKKNNTSCIIHTEFKFEIA